MFDFHSDKPTYFKYQYLTSRDHVIPFIESFGPLTSDQKVLEIGCAEAGVLKAFLEKGHQCMGIELMSSRIELAKQFLAEEVATGQVEFIAKDIYDIPNDEHFKFDLIILKDVIEHIHDQEAFIKKLEGFLTSKGRVFFGFPPWQMPFGGHQQICRSKILSTLPFYHLLPRSIYKLILRIFGEQEVVINNLLEIKDTGISIERFEKIIRKSSLQIGKRKFFLLNPIYKYKLGLNPRVQFGVISAIPVLRNFFTTCAYYLIEKE